MKKHIYQNLLIALILSVSVNVSSQKSYHFSTSEGDDSRSVNQALTASAPWKSIDKLNSIFMMVMPGDSILLRRGDTFYGTVEVTKSGEQGKPIVIAAYGHGPDPVISGLSPITSWNSPAADIYEAVIPGAREMINCVIINGKLQAVGRFPKVTAENGGYLNFESHSGDSLITDTQLQAEPDWSGGEIVIRKNHWILDRTHIISHQGNSIKFKPVTVFYKLVDRSGYFIQNHPACLTQDGDWCYDGVSKKIRLRYSSKPPEVKVSTLDNLLIINSNNYIKVLNLAFEGANQKGITATGGSSIVIENCKINFTGIFGVQLRVSGTAEFNNNSISNCLNNAFSLSAHGTGTCSVRNNIITNTGLIAGMSGSGDGNCNAMSVNTEDGAVIEYNTIKNTGYIPLNFSGNNILIKNNVIDNYLLVKQDGAGIYTWNGGTPVKQFRNRVIIGNILSNGIGNAYGTIEGKPSANGIYMDNNVNHVKILNNTVYNISGKGNHNNSPSQVTIRGNTFFNVGQCFDLVRWVNDGTRPENGGQDIKDMDIQKNLFFTLSPRQSACAYADRGLNFPEPSTIKERISSMGVIDSNIYYLPNELGFSYSYQAEKYVDSPPMTYDAWKSLTGYEKHSRVLPLFPGYRINKLLSGNLCLNGKFEKSIDDVKSASSGIDFKVGLDRSHKLSGAGSLSVTFQSLPPSSRSYVMLSGPVGKINHKNNYILRFTTLSTANNGILRVTLKNGTDNKSLAASQSEPLVNSKTRHEFLIKAPDLSDNGYWGIDLYQGSGTTYIDDIELYRADVSDININDYIRLEVNPGKEIRTVVLDKTYMSPEGKEYKGKIDIQPFSSRILISPQK